MTISINRTTFLAAIYYAALVLNAYAIGDLSKHVKPSAKADRLALCCQANMIKTLYEWGALEPND